MSLNRPSPPPLPREHGAWVMLTLPLLLGLVLVGPRPSPGWILAVVAVAVFLAHYSLVPVVQRVLAGKPAPPEWRSRRLVWGAVYLGSAAGLFALTIVLSGAGVRAELLQISTAAAVGGAIYFAAACAGRGRVAAVELVGMAAMSLMAPLMALAAGHLLEERQLGAALLAFVYSASALSYVRAYGSDGTRRRAFVLACVSHLGLIALAAWVARDGWLPSWWPVAFVPVVFRLFLGFVFPPRNLRALGMREAWVASVYTLIAIALVVV